MTARSADHSLGCLPAELLQRVFTHLPFRHMMLREGVCRVWRAILRCSDMPSSNTGSGLSGIWGEIKIDFDHPADVEEILPEHCNVGIHFPFGGLTKRTCFTVKASGCSLTQQERGFVAWVRQRAVGAQSISLLCNPQDPGWMFAELVLAVSKSGGHLSARPPVALASGMGSDTVKESASALADQRLFTMSLPCQVCLLLLCMH